MLLYIYHSMYVSYSLSILIAMGESIQFPKPESEIRFWLGNIIQLYWTNAS